MSSEKPRIWQRLGLVMRFVDQMVRAPHEDTENVLRHHALVAQAQELDLVAGRGEYKYRSELPSHRQAVTVTVIVEVGDGVG